VYVNETFIWSAIIGGVVMGAGFIMGGYCPGTSFCGAAIGKIDAMIFIVGLFLGVFIFAEGYPLWEDLYKAGFLGSPRISEFFNISEGLFALFVIIAAILMFWGAEWAEKKFPREEY
jgi:uncharacterized membrane protein YedE/YeeE